MKENVSGCFFLNTVYVACSIVFIVSMLFILLLVFVYSAYFFELLNENCWQFLDF